MNCLDCRRLLFTQPQTRTAELAAHLSECPGCARLARQQAHFEQHLDAALRIPVPENLRERVRFAASMQRPRRRWLVAAAAIVAVVSVGLSVSGWEFWNSHRLTSAIASEIASQMQAPPLSAPGADRITNPRLARLATHLSAYLDSADMGEILSARQSTIRGRQAAQFLIARGQQRARIFMLLDTWLVVAHDVAADGVPGKLIPSDDGVIAVFCPDRRMLARVAEDLGHSLRPRS